MDEAWALVQRHLVLRDGVRRGRIFRASGLRYHDHFVCFLNREGLVLRMSSDRVTELIGTRIGRPFVSGARLREDWVVIPHGAVEHWLDLASEALGYAESS